MNTIHIINNTFSISNYVRITYWDQIIPKVFKISSISLSHLKLFRHSIASVQSIRFSGDILAYINSKKEMDLFKQIEKYD